MSCNKIYTTNLVQKDETEIVASSENAFFPAENLRDIRRAKSWRTANGVFSATVVFDFKTAEPVDAIMIVGDSLRGLGLSSIIIEANITDSWGAPLFSTSIAPNPKHNWGFKDVSLTKPEYRFWRVTISGAAPYVELSKIYIGPELGLSRSINLNWSYLNRDKSSHTRNKFGTKFSDLRNKQKEIVVGYSKLSSEDMAILQDAVDANGEYVPFWFVVDPDELISDSNGRFAGMFQLESVPQANNPFYKRFDYNNLRFVEAI